MSYATVVGDKVVLYSYIERETESRVNVCAKLPNQEWNGQRLNVLHWKIDAEAQTVVLRYMLRDHICAPIYETKFPVVKDAFKLPRPNRSKNWQLDQYQDLWRNVKTGKKVYV